MRDYDDADSIVQQVIDSPDSTSSDLLRAGFRVMLMAEVQEPGTYGMAGLPQAMMALAKHAAAESEAGQDTSFIEQLRKFAEFDDAPG